MFTSIWLINTTFSCEAINFPEQLFQEKKNLVNLCLCEAILVEQSIKDMWMEMISVQLHAIFSPFLWICSDWNCTESYLLRR